MRNLSEKLGASIRRYRIAGGLTQHELARLAGLTSGYLSDVERGKVNISIANLNSLADALNVPLATLLDCEDADRDALMAAIAAHLAALPTDALHLVRHMTCLMTHYPKEESCL